MSYDSESIHACNFKSAFCLAKQLSGTATRDPHFRWSGLLLNMNCNFYQAFIFQRWQNTNYKCKENHVTSVIDLYVIILDK